MSRSMKKGKSIPMSLVQQLSIFDQEYFQNITHQTAKELFSPENLALGGLTDSIPSLRPYFRILPSTVIVPAGNKGKLIANLNAIKTAKLIRAQNRKATPEEQAELVQYTGWGGLSSFWDKDGYSACLVAREFAEEVDEHYLKWAKQYGKLRLEVDEVLTKNEIEQAERSTVNAFYTSREIVTAMWQALNGFGFKGGNILEPAAAIGHFYGLMPTQIRDKSTLTAVEKDTVSAQILEALYPEVSVFNSGFEDCHFENNSFDLVIGNVPFGDFKVYDSQNKDLSGFNIHNYFIGRSARLIRPGGLLALITTAGTLDASGKAFRQKLFDEGIELAGAIRLPSSTFEANAGTEVTTDILLFQKKQGLERRFLNNTYLQTATIRTIPALEEEGEVKSIRINEYFADRPVMMIGKMFFAGEVGKGGLYSDDRQTLFLDNQDDFQPLLEKALQALPTNIFTAISRNPLSELGKDAVSRSHVFNAVVRIKGRSFIQSMIIREYDNLKLLFRELLDAEIKGEPDEVAEPLRERLNRAYDKFVWSFGHLTRNRYLQFLETWDPQFSSVQSLEFVEREPGNANKVVVTKSAILEGRVYPLNPIPEQVETVADALQLSMYIKGGINLEYMAGKLNRSTNEVESELISSELAFREPSTLNLVDRDTYLSGNVRKKIEVALSVCVEQPAFSVNVRALEKVLPTSIPLALITFQLGSVWIPTQIIEEFIYKTLEITTKVDYNSIAAEYHLENKNAYSVKNNALGTSERKAIDLIEAALNSRSVVVMKTIYVHGDKREVKDVEATSQAVQAQEALQELFTDFVRDNYAEKIEKEFNQQFNSYVLKTYHKPNVAHYPGANKEIFLRQHQFRGVERIKDQDTLLAHVVGSGKSFTMISAVMELKRLGYINKAVVAVQNSTVDDFYKAWKSLYPSSIIYAPDKADLELKNRARFLQRIATNNFDGIILPNSFLKMIPDDPIDEETLIANELAQVTAKLLNLSKSSKKHKQTVKTINKKKLAIEAKRKEQRDRKLDNILNFGQLGVDFLALDEAHTKKRLGFTTHRRGIKGIDTEGSQDALQALTKCLTIQRKGGRVVLATGTPISNTMAEAWTMLRFIAAERLAEMNLTTFDQFAGTFGKVIPSFELSASGQFKCVDRFAKFVNVGQLSKLYRSYVDVVLNEDIDEFKRDKTLPLKKNGDYTRIIIPQTDGVASELSRIRAELKWYERLSGEQKKENSHIPLVMFGQAKKATLDIRLLDVNNPDEEGSKVNVAVQQILTKYKQTNRYKGTQLVFSDSYQSPSAKEPFIDEDGQIPNPNYGKTRFNLFEDIKAKLIAAGVPECEIAIVPADAKKREPVFMKVRTGEIRVMMGTSERMGVGVNVQERLAAAHYLDAPNLPTNFEQRDGRIERQGNLHAVWNEPIEIFTYGVEKTLDATAYGRLAIKKKFINQLLKGTIDSDTIGDISSEDDFASMTFDQMMATLSGSQYALLYTAKNHELTRLGQQKKNWQRGLIDAQWHVDKAKREIEFHTSRLPQLELESELIKSKFGDQSISHVEVNGELFTEGWTGAVENYTLDLKARAKRGATELAKGTIKVNGITIGLQGGLVNYDLDGRPLFGIDYSWGLTLKGSVLNGPGLIISLRSAVNRVMEAPDESKEVINHYQKVHKEFSFKLNQPFKGEELLKSLKEEVEGLKRVMEQETNENGNPNESALEKAMQEMPA